MRRYPIIALLSVLNVLVLLSMLGKWGSLFGFIAEILPTILVTSSQARSNCSDIIWQAC